MMVAGLLVGSLVVHLVVEEDGFGLDLPVLDIHLVASQNNGNILAHPDQIAAPVGDVHVGHSACHIKMIAHWPICQNSCVLL